MNDVIKSGNIIKKIRDGKQLEEIALFARNCIFRDGPKDTLVLEILSYLKLFQPTFFEKFEDELIETMGLFFKIPLQTHFKVLFLICIANILKKSMARIIPRCRQVS